MSPYENEIYRSFMTIFEVRIDKEHGLNKLFQSLNGNDKGLEINSVELKDARLEKIFMEMTK